MAVFDFNDGGALVASNGATPSITFDEEGITFVLSSAAGNPGTETVAYAPNSLAQLSLSDFATGGAFTLNVAGTEPNQYFSGNGLQFTIGTYLSGTWNITFVAVDPNNGNALLPGSNYVVTNANASIQVITVPDSGTVYSQIRFTASNPGTNTITIDNLTANLLCFLEGTMIATPEGEKAVQDLRAGDRVLTADGGISTVQWLGEQPVETSLSNPSKVNPIRIRAGALAENVPARDLLVSPDHAIGIDGYLVNASALINGSSITREARMPTDGFTYFHVETGTHELLLAEGCAAESYVDFVGRDGFVNGAERTEAPAIPEMAAPRISAARHLPPALRDALARRAEALGLLSRAA